MSPAAPRTPRTRGAQLPPRSLWIATAPGAAYPPLRGDLVVLYATGRLKPAKSAGTFPKENIDFPTYLVGDRLKRPKGSVADVPRGGGRVLLVDGERIAASRDDAGTACAVSAVCTHMGCLVRGNDAERRWDCPCHGSRFDAAGHVLDGPASHDLEPRPVPGRKPRRTR